MMEPAPGLASNRDSFLRTPLYPSTMEGTSTENNSEPLDGIDQNIVSNKVGVEPNVEDNESIIDITDDEVISSLSGLDSSSSEHLSLEEDDLISSTSEEETSSNQILFLHGIGPTDNEVQEHFQSDSSGGFEILEKTLKVPPRKSRYNVKSQTLCQGVVSTMNMNELWGEIRTLPYDALLKDITFDFEDVKNSTLSMVNLRVGSPVHFKKDTHDGSSASVVVVDVESNNRLIRVPTCENDRDSNISPNKDEQSAPQTQNVIKRTLYANRIAKLRSDGRDGTIRSFDLERGFGFIANQENKYVFVHISRLFTNGTPIIPQNGQRVRFVLDPTPTLPNSRVQVEFGLILDSCKKATQVKQHVPWQHGKVKSMPPPKQNVAVLECSEMNRNIHLNLDIISKFSIPLKPYDEVLFQVNTKAKKPRVLRAHILRYEAIRSSEEILKFLDSALQTLHGYNSAFLIAELAPSDALWQYLGNTAFRKDKKLILRILQFVAQFFKQSRPNTDLDHILAVLLEPSNLLEEVAKLPSDWLVEDYQTVFELCEQVIVKCPSHTIKMFPLMKMTPRPLLEKLLLQFIRHDRSMGEQSNWHSISEGITNEQLLLDDLVKGDKFLSQVKTDEPYDSQFQYMDTYSRLLRAEAFYSIQEGITCMRKGTLKPFQMKVYDEVSLGSVNLDNLNLALHISPKQYQKKNWVSGVGLMTGNLLCLLLNRQLKQIIWMTVAIMDPEVLEKDGFFMAEMCSFNTLTKTEIISALYSASGKITMIESPTYFRSIHPALHTLLKIDMDKLKLCDSIVHAIPSVEKPAYQLKYLQGKGHDADMNAFKEEQMNTMDESQKRAFEHALHSPLGIIQGPPGTGKTYIGSKIIQTILKYDVDSPILVLTYKNHALDEFLKGCLKFCPIKDMVRVGGRSKELALGPCNLFELMKTVQLSGTVQDSTGSLLREQEDWASQLNDLLKSFWSEMSVDAESLLHALTEDQLNDLIRGARWGKGPGKIMYATKKKQCANNTWACNAIDKVILKFGSIRTFLERFSDSTNEQSMCKTAKSLLDVAVRRWLPSLQNLEDLKNLHSGLDIKGWLEENTDREESVEATPEEQEHRDENLETRNNVHDAQDSRIRIGNFCTVPEQILSSSSFTREHFPSDLEINPNILRTRHMWWLSQGERYRFIFSLIHNQVDEMESKIHYTILEIENILAKLSELKSLKKLDVLQSKKIIGMTISGASINSVILQQVRPKVVVVEEAAEVLEPQLVAALNESVEHLILIGDHQQLRPHLEAHSLAKDYHFDISMMERLIRCQFPYTALSTQNRMRPEFAELLSDIYADYETNLDRVADNDPPCFMEKSMFFWTHTHQEDLKHVGSKTNRAEANVVIAFTGFLIKNGIDPQKITILAAYLGQVRLIRSQLLTMGKSETLPTVQTVDMFQGDENDVIVVSLVRSNSQGSVGFLNSINRRCVLQSRARCGFYLIGNEKMLVQGHAAKVWKPLVQSMEIQGCLGHQLPLKCYQHPSQIHVSTADELNDIVRNPSKLCSRTCGALFKCQIHVCHKTCFPQHSHDTCLSTVPDQFPVCNHQVIRPCWKSIPDLECLELIDRNLPCGHVAQAPCHVDIREIICKVPCPKLMECADKHPCQNRMCKEHDHPAQSCKMQIPFCFPNCNHPSPRRKACGEEITMACFAEVKFTGVCGHLLMKRCCETEKDIVCKNPCTGKVRSCGHVCYNRCGDDCDFGDCAVCDKDVERFKNKAKANVKRLIAKRGKVDFSLTDLDAHDPQFFTVQDQVTKYVKAMHNWSPVITRIQLVTNLEREIAYERIKSTGFGIYEDLKFHGTSDVGITQIPKYGFRMPATNGRHIRPGMFGHGIYFATDSSKSAQEIYTKGSNKLLLCQVFLGKCHTLRTASQNMNVDQLQNLKCDSVFAPRGSSVKNDEFVVYHKDQAYVKYIIHFYQSGLKSRVVQVPFKADVLPLRRILKPSRHFSASNPDDMLYRIAESAFYRCGLQNHRKIQFVEHITNPTLELDFQRKKANFRGRGIPNREILVFHGTDTSKVDGILRNNLRLQDLTKLPYGRGFYFSEYPNIRQGNGNTLMLFKILPGYEYEGPDQTWPKFQSKTISKSTNGYGQMVIVNDPQQFLPFFIYYLE